MSKCISSEGEYSDHELAEQPRFVCARCFAFDEEAALAALAEAERERDNAEKQVQIRSEDSIAARIARSNVRAVEEWAATQKRLADLEALVAKQERYIEELERVDGVGLLARAEAYRQERGEQ